MSVFICSISNEPTDQPVVSPLSGRLFDRRLIEKYVEENSCDPITNAPLTQDMLIEVKVTAPLSKPKPPVATSIPGLLKSLQDEWDAVMLHSFTLRQQLQAARQELSHALYQHDAACRVIARLNKEVSAAREALATLKPQAGLSVQPGQVSQPASSMISVNNHNQQLSSSSDSVDTIANVVGVTPEIVTKFEQTASTLTQQRKQRGKKLPEGLTSVESMKEFVCKASHVGIHSASIPGILCLDLSVYDSSKLLTGGNDRTATVFNKDSEQVVAVFKGHTKKVTKVLCHPSENVAVTASADSTVRVWDIGTAQQTSLIKAHQGSVRGLSLHPTGDFILSCSMDEHWALSDIHTGSVLLRETDRSADQQPLTCGQFHPDGLIFGTGTSDSMIKIWDLKERSNVANFPGHTGQLTSIAFSENGYYLASGAEDAVIKIWDLRKLKNIKSIVLDEKYEIKDLAFDSSGVYLVVAGSDVRVYQIKQWEMLSSFKDHTCEATCARFGPNASFIVSSSMDRSLKVFSQ